MEIHVWRENGDHRAWFDHDYIAPIQTEVPPEGIVEIALDPPVEICAECDFHVGHVLLVDDGPTLAIDSSESDETRAMLWDFKEGVWYTVGEDVGGTTVYRYYMVRAQVEYHDIVTDKLFTDVTEETGFGSPSDISAVDYDQDGDVDVLQNGRLLRNDDGVFTDVSAEVGLSGYQSVSGGVFADYDRDGDLDLVVMNLAHTRFLDFSDLSNIYLNPLGSGTVEFQDVREQVGVPYDGTAFDPALGDYDNG